MVAIKTLALHQEFEGAALVDARERFFKEAEAAGRLKHPNIVTIDGSGEAQGSPTSRWSSWSART